MSTRLIRSIYNTKPTMWGGVVTIGNFDGVHLGHQQLLKKVIEKAKALQKPSTVITFEPHPFEFFDKDHLQIPRLTRLREKFSALADCGIENVLILPFNQELAELSASDFVKNIIYKSLRPQHVLVGDDFRFGHRRQGDFSLLQSLGQSLGFSVEAMPTFISDGERVSSTRVRTALAQGELAVVQKLLGRPYTMMGRVRGGDQLGRQWGFPTANIYLHRKLTPIGGVFTVTMEGVADKPWPGVANIGIRPTLDGTRCLLEVHLLDFNRDIYGRYVKITFCKKLRDEVRYPNVDLLKEQIAKDILLAREYFQQQGML